MAIKLDNLVNLNILSSLDRSQNVLNRSIERLATGRRVNSAADDAAAINIINRLTAEIGGLDQASRNINSGIAVAQTVDGVLQESTNLLTRARELSVQAANGSLTDSQRSLIQTEVSQLQNEFTRLADTTTLGGRNLLDGTFINQSFQIGPDGNQTISLSLPDASADVIGRFNVDSTSAASGLGAVSTRGNTFQSNNFQSQTLTVNGSSSSTLTTFSAGATARDIAQSVNSVTQSTGVSATANTSATLSGLSANGTVSFNLRGNAGNGSVAISASVTTTDLSNLSESINAQSSTTGITAVSNGGTLTLTSIEGFDIAIQGFSNSAGGTQTFDFGTSAGTVALTDDAVNDSATVGGVVSFNSTDTFTVTSDTGASFLATSPATGLLEAFSSVDVSSQAGASAALDIIDFSLTAIDEIRSTVGAFENRITASLSANTSQEINSSAARSQIQDADFAVELANLTKAQILQQTAIALFGQANASKQNILTLLNGTSLTTGISAR